MKIATFNVEFLFVEGQHKHSGKTWNYSKEFVDARIEALAKMISEIDADIVFLQEIASETVLKRIIDRTGIKYSHFLAQPDKRNVGNAVIYRLSNCEVRSIPAVTDFPVLIEGDTDVLGNKLFSRRAFVSLITTYEDKPLHLFGLHLNARFFVHLQGKNGNPLPTETQIQAADGLIRSEVFRSVQARKMRQVIDKIFEHDAKAQIIVSGDFNSQVRETPFRIIAGEFSTHDDALVSAVEIKHVDKEFSFIGEHGPKLIDHILMSKPLVKYVKTFRIFNENLKYHSNKPPTPEFIESDHAPLVVELE